MVVIKLLTDTKAEKDKAFLSVTLGDPISRFTKSIGTKSGIARHDLWLVADQKAAKRAKNPKLLVLTEKLNPKIAFNKQNVSADDFIYVKKRGAPPNAPEEVKAAKPPTPAAPAAPAEPPPPAADPPPAPPTPAVPAVAPPPTPAVAPPPAPAVAPPPPPAASPPAPPTPAIAIPPPAEVQQPVSVAPIPPAAPAAAATVQDVAQPPPAPPSSEPQVKTAAPTQPHTVAPLPTPAIKEKEPEKSPHQPLPPNSKTKVEDGDDNQGSAVEAFIEEIKELGMKKRGESDGVGGVLGAIMTELSMKPSDEREYYRGLGRERSRSPVAKWAKSNKNSPAARNMLEVAGLIESIENPRLGKSTPQHGSSPSDEGTIPRSRLDATGQQVADFLSRIGLQKYTQRFLSSDIDMETLVSLTEAELAEIGVQSLGAKKRIMVEIERMKGRPDRVQNFSEHHGDHQVFQDVHHPPPSHDWIRGMDYQHQTERNDLEQLMSQMKYEDERALRREKELERKWEEVRLLDRAGNPSEWESRWEDAKAFDFQEICRWKSRVRNDSRVHSPPPSSRRDLLLQRLSDIKADERRGRTSPPPATSHLQTFYTAQGVPYYYNTLTNQTTWTRPSPPRRGRSNGRRPQSPTYREMSPTYPHYQYPGY